MLSSSARQCNSKRHHSHHQRLIALRPRPDPLTLLGPSPHQAAADLPSLSRHHPSLPSCFALYLVTPAACATSDPCYRCQPKWSTVKRTHQLGSLPSMCFSSIGCYLQLTQDARRCFGDKGDVEDITEGSPPDKQSPSSDVWCLILTAGPSRHNLDGRI